MEAWSQPQSWILRAQRYWVGWRGAPPHSIGRAIGRFAAGPPFGKLVVVVASVFR